MPRNGSGVYSADWVNASPNVTIESAKQNAMIADLVADANAARPITAGGTGSTTASAARDALGLEIGSDIPAFAAASGLLYGLTLSNNVADATNDLDIAVGVAIDGANAHVMTLASALTKRLDAAWAVGTNQGGLDTGSIAEAWYHVWLIKRVDTGVVDVLFSTSATAPTMPANYTLKRRIGSVIRTGGVIKPFVQRGDHFHYVTPTVDRNSTSAVALAVLSVSVPTGVVVQPLISLIQVQGTAGRWAATISDATGSPNINAIDTSVAGQTASIIINGGFFTNTSAQIGYSLLDLGGTVTTASLSTFGWIDTRGR